MPTDCDDADKSSDRLALITISTHSETWEGKVPGGIRVLLANPRWEKKLELSGMERVMADGTDCKQLH
jgi:hypothetical protein